VCGMSEKDWKKSTRQGELGFKAGMKTDYKRESRIKEGQLGGGEGRKFLNRPEEKWRKRGEKETKRDENDILY